MAYTRKSCFVKVETSGVSREHGKEIQLGLTSQIEAAKLSPDGLSSSAISIEVDFLLTTIHQHIIINPDKTQVHITNEPAKHRETEVDKPKKKSLFSKK